MDYIILLAIFTAQLVSSLLSTLTIYGAVGRSAIKFISIAAISDTVKLSVIAGVTIQALHGNWVSIAAAVLGGAVGNTIAYYMKNNLRGA
jgi:hypothetical protein